MTKIKNPWKVATLSLSVLILILTIVATYQNGNQIEYDFGDIKISKANFDALKDKAIELDLNPFRICNIPKDKCIEVYYNDGE